MKGRVGEGGIKGRVEGMKVKVRGRWYERERRKINEE